VRVRVRVYALCPGSLVSVLLPFVSPFIVLGVSVVVLGCGWFGVATIGFGEEVVEFGVARVRLVLVVAVDTVIDVGGIRSRSFQGAAYFRTRGCALCSEREVVDN
jgi:hypothetical protein